MVDSKSYVDNICMYHTVVHTFNHILLDRNSFIFPFAVPHSSRAREKARLVQ